MITREEIMAELKKYKKLDTLEPLFDSITAYDSDHVTRVYSYEELRNEYNDLIDDIQHLLWKINSLSQEAEEYASAYEQLADKLFG